ncbi:hypothetical protein IJG89_01280 [Candidatus Saccharibacteria bacterium]|nr:hypothetical protein [Candidatus Saccharibacteria bacterium]
MDGNSGGTPNPLSQPTATPANTNPVAAQPAEPAVPTQVAEVKPAKDKKKTGLIVGGIIALFVLVGCGVAAALFFLSPKTDPVTAAMQRLLSGEVGSNLGVKGTIDVAINSDEMPVSSVKLALDGQASLSTKVSSANVGVTATMKESGNSATANLSEISSSDGSFFVKLENVADAIETLTTTDVTDCALDAEEVDCVELETAEESLSYAQGYSDILELFENQWFRISAEDLEGTGMDVDTDVAECATNFADSLSNSRNSINELYKKYAFISSSTENLPVAKKNNPIYKIEIDGDNLTSFMNEFVNLPAVSGFLSCTGASAETIDAEEVKESLDELPDLYVEIDGNYNFTRLYFVLAPEDSEYAITTDLDFSYPENVIVSEPEDYQDLMTYIQNLMTVSEDY